MCFLEPNNRTKWPLKCIYDQFDDIMQHQCTEYTKQRRTVFHSKSKILRLLLPDKSTFSFRFFIIFLHRIFISFSAIEVMLYGMFGISMQTAYAIDSSPIFYLKFWKLVNNRQKHYNWHGDTAVMHTYTHNVRAHIHAQCAVHCATMRCALCTQRVR